MRHHIDHRKLGVTTSHRLAMMRALTCALIEHGQITTTLPKAKEARRYAEKVITLGKKAATAAEPAQKLHYSRQAMVALHSKEAVAKLVGEIAPKYLDRKGGYTRVLKAGFRLGDRSPKAVFALV